MILVDHPERAGTLKQTIGKPARLKGLSCLIVFFLFISRLSAGIKSGDQPASGYISSHKTSDGFVLSKDGKSAPLVIDPNDFPGVIRVAGYVQEDLAKVTGVRPELLTGELPPSGEIVVAGTLGKSSLIDELVKNKKIDVSDISGKWESTLTQVVDKPFPGIAKALVIAGSDKRGTIYGLFALSKNCGVSPWYFWADVPVKHQDSLFVKAGRWLSGEPKVKYRGIFLNDEEPALGRWAVKNYGGFNHQFYEKVFELILRLRGNYLWPAMWWASFNSNDTINPVLADEMGIVMGTSHHEPMMRAHAEWKPFGGEAWNYETNPGQLREFWKQGIERMDHHESIVTIGMRGDGDMAMSQSTNIALLEKIVADQRKIIADVTGKPAEETPQMWALYKEVQDYYDKGMRVPDDVTLLLCDDNWGNIRKLPKPDAAPRNGGYGIYYHFDYVGGPRNYKWLNTNPLPRVWEQMHMAYEYGVKEVWLVNVGDLKPMELPISFFLDYAWNPDEWPANRLPEYPVQWAAQQFGPDHASEIGEILSTYARFNGRRKPELLSPETYSLNNFQEFENVSEDYNQLAKRAEELAKKLPADEQDAYYELVLYPVTACANLNQLYFAAAKNRQAVGQGRATANDWAEKVKELFQKDADITAYCHTKLANGKWDHMMAQTHIGYSSWQEPPENKMPDVKEITLPGKAEMGIAIQGSGSSWTAGTASDLLPEMDAFNRQSVYIDIFNRGSAPFEYVVETAEPWLRVSPEHGKIEREHRVWLSADWSKVPIGKHVVDVKIQQRNGNSVTVQALVNHSGMPDLKSFQGFIESNGYVSMEAEHFTRDIQANGMSWKLIPDLGRTQSAMAAFPVKSPVQEPGNNCPHLEYDMYLYQAGNAKVMLYLSPSLNFFNDEGLKIAVSFDDQQPQILAFDKDEARNWNKWVSENIIKASSNHQLEQAGKHTLKIWMVTPGAVLQKIVVHSDKPILECGLAEAEPDGKTVRHQVAEKRTYLGEPESAQY
jgi:hypothetical protein